MLVVRDEKGQEYKVDGRVARIMTWFLTHLERINGYDGKARGEIIITYAGKSLRASLKQIENL